MEAEEQILSQLRASEAARLIAHAAVKAGRDPYRDLGLPDAPLTLTTARLIFDLLNVREEGEQSDTDLDQDAEALLARMDADDAWAEATGEEEGGYQGPRGLTPPGVPRTSPLPRLSRDQRPNRETPGNLSSWLDITVPGPYALSVKFE